MFGLILQFIIWLRHLTHRAIKNSPYFYSDLFISPSTTLKGLNHFLPPVFSAGPYTSFTFRGLPMILSSRKTTSTSSFSFRSVFLPRSHNRSHSSDHIRNRNRNGQYLSTSRR